MKRLILVNGNRCTNDDQVEPCDLVVLDGKLVSWKCPMDVNDDDTIIDLKGGLITPGLVDIHVHLREPGQTHKETIASGTQAAARGGFTSICAMPNTNPVPDTVEKMDALMALIKKDACVHVYPYAPITMGLNSTMLVDQENLMRHGAIAFTNDGLGIQSANVMFEAMQSANATSAIIVAHAEDESLKRDGVVHEGEVSKRLSLPGILSVSESAQVARDLALAEALNVHYHVCHVSTAQTVQLIRDAKKRGVHVSAEVTAHHLLLDETDILKDDANFKMNPPLRSYSDRMALLEGLKRGDLDCIASDHAPHSPAEKMQGMLHAPFGIIGMEYAFGLLYTRFVRSKNMTLQQLIDWMSDAPTRLFKLPQTNIELGQLLNCAVFDLEGWVEITDSFKSKAKNSPFIGQRIQGDCIMTIVDGNIVWRKYA